MGEGLLKRTMEASAAALGAAIVLLPSPVCRQPAPPPEHPSSAAPVAVDPLVAQVLERMPAASGELAGAIAGAVRTGAAEAGIDPLLVMAVIEVESEWEASALSGHGARGLMQLRGPTLAMVEREAGVAPGDARDPVHNVRMGIRYLGRMVKEFGGEDLGLMAYNAGPTRLLAHLLAVDELPDSLWSYVRKVRLEERKLRSGMMRVAGQRTSSGSRA
jgi:soluble lytic murein transglycosylase